MSLKHPELVECATAQVIKCCAPRHAIGGMPTCRLCERSFTKWRQLKLHIECGSCPALGGSSFKLSPQMEDHARVGREASEKQTDEPSKCSQRLSASAEVDQPLVLRLSFHAQLTAWEDLLSCRKTRTLLSSRCVICHLWIASSRHIKQHYNRTHHQDHPQLLALTEVLCQSFKGHFTRGRACKFCGSCVGALTSVYRSSPAVFGCYFPPARAAPSGR